MAIISKTFTGVFDAQGFNPAAEGVDPDKMLAYYHADKGSGLVAWVGIPKTTHDAGVEGDIDAALEVALA